MMYVPSPHLPAQRADWGVPRRGVALLLVLLALAACMTTLVSLAAVASHARALRTAAIDAAQCDDLRQGAEGAIAVWLERSSATVSLPPDATVPSIQVIDVQWRIGRTRVEMVIAAFDECAMVPWQSVRDGSGVGVSLPSEIVNAVSACPASQPPGLDLVVDQWTEVEDRAVYPRQGQPLPGVGALVATHNTVPPTINLSTAPRPSVESALLVAGRSGLDAIMQARREGRVAPLPPSIAGADQARVRLVSSSNAWAFRIDLRVGTVRRSWWEVFVRDRTGWNLEQRLAIGD